MKEASGVLKDKLISPPGLDFLDASFIMETGTCSVAMGAVLAHKIEDGRIHAV